MVIDISKDFLLDIDEVCRRLSISRSTLERMRINKGPHGLVAIASRSSRHIASATLSEDDAISAVPFPEPSCFIGRSPRWTAAVINEWIHKQTAK
jgi:predicted DNA-binding transcriptional regulator AlpA